MSRPSPTNLDTERPEFLAILGLGLPVTVDDVKQAYLEKAKTAHPDRGGNAQQFIRLQTAFEQATEYARFKAGRSQWLARWIEEYVDQQQFAQEVQALGGEVDVGTVDWLERSIGPDFATVLDQIVAIRLSGPQIDDDVLGQLGSRPRMFTGLQRLGLVNTRVTYAGLRRLRECYRLEHLDLSGTRIDMDDLREFLRGLPMIQSIQLGNTGIGWWSRMRLKWAHRGLRVTA
jgi:hypothetical protein